MLPTSMRKLWPLALLFAALSSTGVAHAADVGAPSAGFGIAAAVELVTVVAGLLVTALLVNLFAPARRKRLRRALVLVGLYVAVFVAARLLGYFAPGAWAEHASLVADVLRALAIVNLAGIAVFDLALPLLHVEVTDIVGDLTVGGAYVVMSFAVLRQAGMNPTSMLTTSAVLGAVLAVSLQATLGNILGGIALQLDGSIHLGEWIQLENGRQGRVSEIRWRHTVVETRDYDTLIVPNASLLAQTIHILGKRGGEPVPHRMWVYFNVDFRYSPAEVIRVVEEALRGAPIEGVAREPPPNCICFDFSRDRKESVAFYAVRYFLTDLARDDPTSSAVRTRIFAALKRAAIPLAVPATTVFVSHDDPEHAELKAQREHDRRVEAIRAVDLFESMTQQERDGLAERIRFTPFGPGEIITRQGATAHWFYVLTRGEVEVRVRGDNGEENAVTTMKAPNFFGEMGVMTGAPRSSTVVARGEVDCYRIDKRDFHEILRIRPEIAVGISAKLAERRVELATVRDGLDDEGRKSQIDLEHGRILAGIRSFFGIDQASR